VDQFNGTSPVGINRPLNGKLGRRSAERSGRNAMPSVVKISANRDDCAAVARTDALREKLRSMRVTSRSGSIRRKEENSTKSPAIIARKVAKVEQPITKGRIEEAKNPKRPPRSGENPIEDARSKGRAELAGSRASE